MQEELFDNLVDPIWTVSELTRQIKSLLENQFSSILLSGEISNFHAHSSGHCYFTLKDQNAQISAVLFRGARKLVKFEPENGLEIIVSGRISLYEPRGNYQIIVETMEPKGLGALQLAFEQLKERLDKEGLFSEKRKQSLPFLPRTVGIITSPTGAAVRDLIKILRRRNPQVNILLCPVSVQGENAAPEIAQAIQLMNQHGEADIIIVGRGGGSLEDLWAFNTEIVARAIADSHIPTISAVGHESDFTIADFVADLRAATPSAAAELSVPVLNELVTLLLERKTQLYRKIQANINTHVQELRHLHRRLKHPKQKLDELKQRLDQNDQLLQRALGEKLLNYRTQIRHLSEKLHVLSPLSTLSRGYSIVRTILPSGTLGPPVKKPEQAPTGSQIQVDIMAGQLKAIIQ